MKTTRKKVQLRQIVAHPARDRSPLKIDDDLVQLVVQIIATGGINDHESILVGPHEEKDCFYNLSGWRRFNALILAIGLQEVAAADPDKFGVGEDGFTTEYVGHHLPAIVLPISADLETAVAHMITHLYGEQKISAAFINVKDRLEQGLILTAANSGRQEPDVLGRANSYHWLVTNGASPAQIAQRNGQSVHQVSGIYANPFIHPAAHYFYAYNPETDVYTRGHDCINGVLYDIDTMLLEEDEYKRIGVRYGDLIPEPEPIEVTELDTGTNEDTSAEIPTLPVNHNTCLQLESP